MVLELLADAPDIAGGRVQPLPTAGTISALNIPHASIVFDLHQVVEIRAELLGDNGVATEKLKHANLVSFTCLKSFAFDQRFERKDAHDLVYCIEHAPEGIDAVAGAFRRSAMASMVPLSKPRWRSCAAASPATTRSRAIARTARYRSPGSSWARATSRGSAKHGYCGSARSAM